MGACDSSASTDPVEPPAGAGCGLPRRAPASADIPAERTAVAATGQSAELQRVVDILTAGGERIRGCRVEPARPSLQALQDIVGWTLGGYDTRPTEERKRQKHHDRLQILLKYRQPPPPSPGELPDIRMYDYLCDTLFKVPMRAVSPDVVIPDMLDLNGNVVEPSWVEADWDRFRCPDATRPAPVFQPNLYPYQLPRRPLPKGDSTPEFLRQTQHWILWYFHYPDEQLPDPRDAEIDSTIRSELMLLLGSYGYQSFDYIWYRNPGMSVPDLFHVQVFWVATGEDNPSGL